MRAGWRPMGCADLPAVERIAAAVHPGYPEDAAVLAERLALHPGGCWMLEGAEEPVGYAISHPWHRRRPPALNTPLGALPDAPGTYYVHDVALLPAARGQGAAGRLMPLLLAAARGLPELSLVAVGGSVPFWERQGFRVVDDPVLADKLRSYDAEARFMRRALRGDTADL
ncbi:GNAT family N-acetyltransferase [Pseudoroseomonas rhizosphaerae]|uniref:GNAT family N-acetyltransferase n=1 Tax=Teichococcus rhizosphaerae TaxID=1335062 RepID=A0A2C7AH62_9PROT|nr:GNAT family N-acetyltransferase [Pseudoroseomonas rhizosphaerae]PHK96825.1 GNAT family N-acetyltransferase [Pseudoroseomonas rhizosphaerae]